ncbi:MAG: DUF1993 domain-containing protein [Caldimonas sp.]
MSLSAYDLSAGVFVRGLTNLKAQLTKAEAHATDRASGEAGLLNAQLAPRVSGAASGEPNDLHTYSLAAHVHWAAEGAKLALARLLGEPAVPTANDAKSFADLHERLDATIVHLLRISPGDLEAGLDRAIVLEHRRGATNSSGGQFLVAFAIPHFFYHVTTAYGILRNQGVQLTMADYLGNWGVS